MERFPVEPKKRKFIEIGIRIIDTIVYAAVFAGGIYALFFTPRTITEELIGWEWMIPFWAGSLLIGGLMGLIGRISTIWLLEPPATVACAVGILIYFVVLGRHSFETLTSVVATTMVLVALLSIGRRYLELQLFGSDPAARDFRARLNDAFYRRIPNVPQGR